MIISHKKGLGGIGQDLVGRSIITKSKISKLTPILSLIPFQQTKLWVMPDDSSARKQEVEYWTGLWALITVSTISNW